MTNIQEQINHNFVSPLYFAQIPNIAVIDLTPNEYILYGAYLRTIWNSENGSCWKSQSTLAKEIGYSIPTLRKAREGLASKGYIIVESRKDEGETDVITLVNKWQENIERQGGLKDSLQGVEKSFAPPSKDSLHKEEKENKKKEEEKEKKELVILLYENVDLGRETSFTTNTIHDIVEEFGKDKVLSAVRECVLSKGAKGFNLRYLLSVLREQPKPTAKPQKEPSLADYPDDGGIYDIGAITDALVAKHDEMEKNASWRYQTRN